MRGEKNVSTKKGDSNFSADFALGYFYRSVKDELNSIAAASSGEISAYELAGRLAAFLLAEESRQELGFEHRVRKVRRQTTKRSKAVAKMALARGARANRSPIKIRTKPHWTQTPEGRKKMSDVKRAEWAKRKAA